MRKQTKLVAVLSAAALLAVGASMTSFAATRNPWVDLGDGDWAYVGSDGERVTSEWRRNGSDYFFLDENGTMARSRLITPDDGDGDAYYYVGGNGVRLKNQWVRVMNDDQESVNDQTPEMFWYYLRENGKAVRADERSEFKRILIDYNGKKRTFFFDAEGRMVTGWIEDEEKGDIYHCDPEGDGSAVTDWQQLEVPEDWNSSGEKEYDYIEYFFFDSQGKMKKGKDGKPAVMYKDGWYYSFDDNGVLLNDWHKVNIVGTSNNVTATSNEVDAFTTSIGTKGTGWIYTDKDDDGEYKHYYLVAFKEAENKTVRNVPFNALGNDSVWRAKTINGKVYVFDNSGVMQTGLKKIGINVDGADADTSVYGLNADGTLASGAGVKTGLPKDTLGGASSRELEPGIYFFNNGDRSVKGQMMTGKQTISIDNEDYTYYFNKQSGQAAINKVVDGAIYGSDGRRLEARDGNTYEIITLQADVLLKEDKKNPANNVYIAAGSDVIVSSTGKLRTSTSGHVKVDGIQYKVERNPKDNGKTAGTWPWKVVERVEDN